jgi:hypothetical protein
MNQFETDIVIVGAGPVGLFAIFEAGMLKMRCHVVDTLEAIGGQCAALYPEKPIYDIPAYPSIMAAELINRLEEQAEPFAPVYHLGQQVMRVEGLGDRVNIAPPPQTPTPLHCNYFQRNNYCLPRSYNSSRLRRVRAKSPAPGES